MLRSFNGILPALVIGLKSSRVEYAIIGSANMNLHGMDIQPNDIDILTRIGDLGRIEEIFRDYGRPKRNRMESDFSDNCYQVAFKIHGVDVQIIGDEGEDSVYARNFRDGKIESMKSWGVDVRCFTLAAEEECYRLTGRDDKAKMISDYLARKGSR